MPRLLTKVKALFRGRQAHRYTQNPKELVAALLWQEEHPQPESGVLPYLCGDGNSPREPSPRDWLIAATVIQWLGSPVGQIFFRKLTEAFERIDRKQRSGS